MQPFLNKRVKIALLIAVIAGFLIGFFAMKASAQSQRWLPAYWMNQKEGWYVRVDPDTGCHMILYYQESQTYEAGDVAAIAPRYRNDGKTVYCQAPRK